VILDITGVPFGLPLLSELDWVLEFEGLSRKNGQQCGYVEILYKIFDKEWEVL
jgi:hypothetical protein